MTQVVRVNGDYKIKAPSNKVITLDSGSVLVTGDFTVMGNNTSMEVSNLQIEDRIITVNKGETGAGVTGIYAGLEIDRGSANNAVILYNETEDTWEFAEEVLSGYSLATSKIKINQIVSDVTVNGGNLHLIGDHVGVLTVPNLPFPNSYRDQIISRGNDNDIPNKGYVDFAVSNAPPPRDVGSADTIIRARDKDVFNDLVTISSITVSVDNNINALFFADRTEFHDIRIERSNLEVLASNESLVLLPSGTGRVEIKSGTGIQIDNIATQLIEDELLANPIPNSSILYTKSPGSGESGVYFLNSSKNGELISKNKALVFSMLF